MDLRGTMLKIEEDYAEGMMRRQEWKSQESKNLLTGQDGVLPNEVFIFAGISGSCTCATLRIEAARKNINWYICSNDAIMKQGSISTRHKNNFLAALEVVLDGLRGAVTLKLLHLKICSRIRVLHKAISGMEQVNRCSARQSLWRIQDVMRTSFHCICSVLKTT